MVATMKMNDNVLWHFGLFIQSWFGIRQISCLEKLLNLASLGDENISAKYELSLPSNISFSCPIITFVRRNSCSGHKNHTNPRFHRLWRGNPLSAVAISVRTLFLVLCCRCSETHHRKVVLQQKCLRTYLQRKCMIPAHLRHSTGHRSSTRRIHMIPRIPYCKCIHRTLGTHRKCTTTAH